MIDCSGNPFAFEENFKWVDKYGKILLFGCCPETSKIRIEPYLLYDLEISILTAKINPFTFRQSITLVEQLFLSGYLGQQLGVKNYKLDDFEIAINDLHQKTCTKAIFNLKS